MDKRIVYSIIGAMAAIAIGLAVLVWTQVRGPAVPVYDSDFADGAAGPAVDSGARIEIEKLRSQIEMLSEQINRLQSQINALESQRAIGTAPPADGVQQQGAFPRDGPNLIRDSYAQVVQVANRRELNKGVRIATPSYLASVLGRPRENLTDECQPLTNQRLADKLVIEEVGPIRVQMLEPAVESLRRVFERVRQTDQDLYDRIGTAGSLCVRHVRGSPGSISTHAFGLSVDLNIDGHLDTLGDGMTQLGLTILADFFREEGWYWGAAFTREDSMHFEVGRDLVEQWIEEGRL
jgi:hypothetical protein